MLSFLGFYNSLYPIYATQTLPGVGSITLSSLAAINYLQFLKHDPFPGPYWNTDWWQGQKPSFCLKGGEEIVNSDLSNMSDHSPGTQV